jgi:DNA-binding LacI/PurR family transcriptional regulator
MVAAVVKQLLARIEDTDSAGQRVEINVELKRRSSTRAVQGEF